MNYVKLAAAVTVAAVLGVAGQAVLAQKAPASGSDYQVGDRLAPGAAAQSGVKEGAKAGAGFRDITWDDLIPPDWQPEKLFSDLKLDDMQDNDPRVEEVMRRMRTEWDRAPVIERLAGQRVRIPGFVVPLETDGKTIREFLLVPYFGACVHVPPPPANQLIHVMPDKAVPDQWNMAPVWVSGVLAVARTESDMGTAGYQMRGIRVEPYKEPGAAPER